MAKWTHKIDVDCPYEGKFTVMANKKGFSVISEDGLPPKIGEWGNDDAHFTSLDNYLLRLKRTDDAVISVKLLPIYMENK